MSNRIFSRHLAHTALAFAMGAVVVGVSVDADAGGIATDASALSANQIAANERASLQAEIAKHRDQFPDVHEAVFNVQSVHPHVYKHFRNPIPLAGRELRALGSEALLPMLDALAFNTPERGALTDHEWEAYQTGLIESVGLLNDARSVPILEAVFTQSKQSDAVAIAAATALGRVGAFDALKSHLSETDLLRSAALDGLGEVRSVESVKLLANMLGKATSKTAVEEISLALGTASSSWAWKAMGPEAAADADVVGELAARALMKAFAEQPASRAVIKRMVVMTEHPVTFSLIRDARFVLDQDGVKELDSIERRLKRARNQ